VVDRKGNVDTGNHVAKGVQEEQEEPTTVQRMAAEGTLTAEQQEQRQLIEKVLVGKHVVGGDMMECSNISMFHIATSWINPA